MKLKEYTDPVEIAESIRKGDFSYQSVLNLSSVLKKQNDDRYKLYIDACKEYTKMKKNAIKDFLKEWSK